VRGERLFIAACCLQSTLGLQTSAEGLVTPRRPASPLQPAARGIAAQAGRRRRSSIAGSREHRISGREPPPPLLLRAHERAGCLRCSGSDPILLLMADDHGSTVRRLMDICPAWPTPANFAALRPCSWGRAGFRRDGLAGRRTASCSAWRAGHTHPTVGTEWILGSFHNVN
jgi:hypothetical protein